MLCLSGFELYSRWVPQKRETYYWVISFLCVVHRRHFLDIFLNKSSSNRSSKTLMANTYHYQLPSLSF